MAGKNKAGFKIQWNDETNEYLMLALVETLKKQKVKIPWAQIAQMLHPNFSASVVKNHIHRITESIIERGGIYPPGPLFDVGRPQGGATAFEPRPKRTQFSTRRYKEPVLTDDDDDDGEEEEEEVDLATEDPEADFSPTPSKKRNFRGTAEASSPSKVKKTKPNHELMDDSSSHNAGHDILKLRLSREILENFEQTQGSKIRSSGGEQCNMTNQTEIVTPLSTNSSNHPRSPLNESDSPQLENHPRSQSLAEISYQTDMVTPSGINPSTCRYSSILESESQLHKSEYIQFEPFLCSEARSSYDHPSLMDPQTLFADQSPPQHGISALSPTQPAHYNGVRPPSLTGGPTLEVCRSDIPTLSTNYHGTVPQIISNVSHPDSADIQVRRMTIENQINDFWAQYGTEPFKQPLFIAPEEHHSNLGMDNTLINQNLDQDLNFQTSTNNTAAMQEHCPPIFQGAAGESSLYSDPHDGCGTDPLLRGVILRGNVYPPVFDSALTCVNINQDGSTENTSDYGMNTENNRGGKNFSSFYPNLAISPGPTSFSSNSDETGNGVDISLPAQLRLETFDFEKFEGITQPGASDDFGLPTQQDLNIFDFEECDYLGLMKQGFDGCDWKFE